MLLLLGWVFVAAFGLFSTCGERVLLFIVVHGFLVAGASLIAEHRLCTQSSVVAAHRL